MAGKIFLANNDENRLNEGLMPMLPGFRFCPSDEEIFRYYLVNKNSSQNPNPTALFYHNVIKELDVYGYSPSELSENPFFEYGSRAMIRNWYFYAPARGPIERQRRARFVNDGFWLMMGRGNNVVVGGGGEVLGNKSSFVFYLGNSVLRAVRTDWIMEEFSLPDHAQASFVLYRLFVKPWTGNSSSNPRNDGVLTYEAAPGGDREDVTSGLK